MHSCGSYSPSSPNGSFAYDCSCFLTFQCRIQPSQFHFSHSSPSLSRKFCDFVLQCQHDSFPDPSCKFRGFVLHCRHDPFLDPSYTFRGFVHDFSPGLSCSCHGFVLHCQHGSSVKFLDNLLSFVSYLLIVFRVVQLLDYYMRSLSS